MPNTPDVPEPLRAADDPTPFRRSLRASRARRAVAARRARLHTRGRRTVAVTALATTLLAGGAVAHERTSTRTTRAASSSATAGSIVAAVQAKLGITADGISGPATRHAVRSFQRRQRLTVDGVIGPQTLKALGLAKGTTDRRDLSAAKEAATGRSATPLLEAIALCESGGDPTLVSSSGRYRGKYQFDRSTWRSVGGSGDPAAAPESEQDRRAARLFRERGSSAWPACAKKVGATR